MNDQPIEEMKKQLLGQVMEKEAIERLSRVKLANPLVASQVENYLIEIFQSGKLNKKVSDSELKQILDVLVEKRKTKIKRR